MKVICKSMFCSAMKQHVDEQKFKENKGEYKMECPTCKHKGFMPEHHVLNLDEIIDQIIMTSREALLKDMFKRINYEKLPRSLEQQTMDTGVRYDIDIIAELKKPKDGGN